MPLIDVNDYSYPTGWTSPATADERATQLCANLEAGQILFLKNVPYEISETDRTFLLSQNQSGFKGHKNVSYRPSQDLLRGSAGDAEEQRRMTAIMRNYSRSVTKFLGDLLRPYAKEWSLDFASFRPVEEENRGLPVHKRNDLAHVDAFPTRPTRGGRILRCFTNINPQQPRLWETTDGFESIAKQFADDAGLRRIAAGATGPKATVRRAFAPVFKAIGVKGADRSAYDRFMLGFHDYLKESEQYQKSWPRIRLSFPPGSTWIVFTDSVPHAVLKGQYALEQTYIVPLKAMVTPERAPLRVLENLCGVPLAV